MAYRESYKQTVAVRVDVELLKNIDNLINQDKFNSRSDFIKQAMNQLLEKEQSKLDGRYLIIDKDSLEELKKILDEPEEWIWIQKKENVQSVKERWKKESRWAQKWEDGWKENL